MKKLSFYFSLLILIILVGFNSCTIEKRSYQPGYYVDWHNANKKSKINTEIELKKSQETVCEEKIVVKNNVEKIEDFNQPITILELEPVYASNNENSNNIEIINSTKQKNTFTTNTKKVTSEINESVIKKNTTKAPVITKGAKKTHWAAIVGFVSSILSLVLSRGLLFHTLIMSGVPYLLIDILILLFIIAAVILSIKALKAISNNPDKYRGKGLAIASLIIGGIYLLYKIYGYALLLFLFVIL